MYKNAGKSIKNIVKTVAGVQMVFFIILGLVLSTLLPRGTGFLVLLVVAGGGCFFAWLSGLTLYAFGDIADNMKIVARLLGDASQGNTMCDEEKQQVSSEVFDLNLENRELTKHQSNMVNEYRAQLKNGVITPEQYKNFVENILKEDE